MQRGSRYNSLRAAAQNGLLHLGQVLRRVASHLGLLLCLVHFLVHILLQVDQCLVVVGRWYEEVAGLLALRWLDLAVSCQAEVLDWLLAWFGRGLGRELVDEELLCGLTCFELLATQEHLDLECHVFFGSITSNPEVVVSMFLVKGVLHVVVFSPVDLKELVVLAIVREAGSLLQLLGQDVPTYWLAGLGRLCLLAG